MRSSTWIGLLAYEARIRHAADCGREQRSAQRLASVRARIIADLRCAIAADIEGFLRTAGDQSEAEVTCRNGSSAQGFIVSRADARIKRSLAVDIEADTLNCRYQTGRDPVGGRSDQPVLAIELGNDDGAVSLWDGGFQRTFATVHVLSAFLLAPILSDS